LRVALLSQIQGSAHPAPKLGETQTQKVLTALE